MNDLKGKKAVITGGNSGIGFATAKKFSELGAQVMITGRSADKVSSAAESLSVIGAVADVQDLSQIDNLVDQVKREFGTIDILFVNAGIFAPAPIGQKKCLTNKWGLTLKAPSSPLRSSFPFSMKGRQSLICHRSMPIPGCP